MTISIKQFVERYLGSAVDESGSNRGNYQCFPNSTTKWCHQCVSLIKFFCKSVYDTPNESFWDAGSGYDTNNAFLRGFEHISKNSIPKRGDIVVFERDRSNWNYGHIGIIVYADNDLMYFLEQNAGSGDGYGKGGNAIRISIKPRGEKVIWYRRFSRVQNVIQNDEFDSLLFRGAPYIWEATSHLKRRDVAQKIQKYFGRVDWNSERPNDAITRNELALMISRVSRKALNQIYSGTRPNDTATGVEFTIMMQRWK